MKRPSIDPITQFYIGLAVVVVTMFANGVKLPMGVPEWVGPYLQSWNQFILQIYAPLATFMAASSSSKPGPLAPPDPPEVIAAHKEAEAK